MPYLRPKWPKSFTCFCSKQLKNYIPFGAAHTSDKVHSNLPPPPPLLNIVKITVILSSYSQIQ